MVVLGWVTPNNKFTGTHQYTRVERGTIRVNRLSQEHNTMPPAKAGTWAAPSREEHTNHEAIAPPQATIIESNILA